MSFAARTKKEVTLITQKTCCDQAELTAILQQCGIIRAFDKGKLVLDVAIENAATARRIYVLIKNLSDESLEVLVQRKMRLKKNNIYIVRMRAGVESLLKKLNLLGQDRCSIAQEVGLKRRNSCCKKAFLRGAFLASGSVNDPDSNSYHLEIACHYEAHAQGLCYLMDEFSLKGKMIERKKGFIVYIKEGEKIVDFLGLIGAHQALLHFEDVRIVKGMRNQVNRLVNCETANLNKTIVAAVRQLDNIRFLEKEYGLERLSPKLRIVAEMRLQNPDVTLAELCRLLPDQVSKSGLNHRLRKLDELATTMKNQMGYLEEQTGALADRLV